MGSDIVNIPSYLPTCYTETLYTPQWFDEAKYPLCGFPLPVPTVNLSACCGSGWETIDACFHYCVPAQQFVNGSQKGVAPLEQFRTCVQGETKRQLPANATQPNGFTCNAAASDGMSLNPTFLSVIIATMISVQIVVNFWV
ncbi:Hypothetical protein R9X50_00102700 [Acrodontium crateriforme]|uniref:Uncharacterized protein n=1 Tax=Acrodontium crateriforme TaxID=150365 RepID=A0AAQ3LYN0_9PEZI|nr:Hypothetical protein R9X50_00102700 [Acrodontium crateriforme]